MSSFPFSILLAGKAGDGIKKAASIIANYCGKKGLYVFQYDDYQSVIKGGHNYSIISVDRKPIYSHYESIDIMILLDKKSCQLHYHKNKDKGIVLYNSNEDCSISGIGIPFLNLLKEYSLLPLYVGALATAACLCILGLPLSEIYEIFRTEYKRDIDNNQICAKLVFDHLSNITKNSLPNGTKPLKVMNGNQLIALGALAAGLTYYAGYPMTPASGILHYLAQKQSEFGLVVQHAESEIGAINMAIGATFAGAKAATGSSGGGVALMQEAFSMAGMIESPLLLFLTSRPGPATGMSTYTAQQDLHFALHMGHGEFPRIVASPGSFEEAFFLSATLLSLAWKFQTPTILLTEKHLSESAMSIEIDPTKAEWAQSLPASTTPYLRYENTGNGISPLLFPPSSEVIKWNSHEHLESGTRTDDGAEGVIMLEKRYRKENTICEYLQQNVCTRIYGDSGPLFITYGSTTLTVREAAKHLSFPIRILQIIFLEPFPLWELEKILTQGYYTIEYSLKGQLAELVFAKTGIRTKNVINRYDGRPFEPTALAAVVREVITHE